MCEGGGRGVISKLSVGGECLRRKRSENGKWDIVGNDQQWLAQELITVPSNTAVHDSTSSKMYLWKVCELLLLFWFSSSVPEKGCY